MADKDFIVKNGIVVSNNLIYATADSGEVGINTTNPTANLHVVGTGFFSTTLTANIVQANSISTNSISSSSLSLTGNMSIGGSLTVTNDLAVSRNFGVSGNTNLVGNVTIGGTTSLVNLSGTIGSFSNVNISNFGNIQNANLTNLTVSTSTNISGTATFNNAVVAGFAPTAWNHVVNKSYVDSTFLPLAGGTIAGNMSLTGNMSIINTAPTITMNDTDNSAFYVHCNSNLVGFLPPSGGWGCYMDVNRNWNVAGNLNVTGSMNGASLAGGASTGVGASGTWPINITGNAANGRTKIGEWNMSNWSSWSDANVFNTIGAGYNSFEVEVNGVYPTNTYENSNYAVGANMFLQLAINGVMQGAAGNEYQSRFASAEGTSGALTTGMIPMTWYSTYVGSPPFYGRVTQNAAYNGIVGKIYFQNIKNANGYKLIWGHTNYWNCYYGGAQNDTFSGILRVAGALSGFQIYMNSAGYRNINGIVRIYGYY